MNEFVEMENGIGILKINGKEQETPCFFPTLMFDSERLRKIDDICQDLLSHICKTRLVNFVDICLSTNFKVKRYVLTFVDSGGFRLKEEGAKIIPSKLRIVWNNKEISITDVLSVQNEKGDLGNTLDFPIQQNMENKNDYVLFNLNCAKQSLKVKPDGLFLYGTIQAWDYTSAINYSKRIASLPFDGFAIGGLVQFSREPQKIIDIVAAVRRVIPKEKPVHTFGIANTDLIPILLKLGIDTFDSSSYIRISLNRKYYLALYSEKLSLSPKAMRLDLPCFCPVCHHNKTEVFLQNTIRSYAFLALHNLHQLESFIRYCRLRMIEGNFDDLVNDSIRKLFPKVEPQKIRRYVRKLSESKC